LRLIDGQGVKAPAGASGEIAYDFSSACDGYAQTLRQVVDLQPQEGAAKLTETRSASFEDRKGEDFHFNIATRVGRLHEVDGRAERNGHGDLSIDLTRPKRRTLSAEGDGVLFPTQHIERVLAAARRGQKILLSRVYDGSDNGAKIFDVTAIIGKPETGPDRDRGAQIAALRGMRRWPVALAYFTPAHKDQTPDYVISFNLYDNGVSTGLKFDYGNFVLAGELTGIEFPPAAKCRR